VTTKFSKSLRNRKIPERCKRQGWRSCASELRKVVGFLDMPYGKGGGPLPCRPVGGSMSYNVGGALLMSMGSQPVL